MAGQAVDKLYQARSPTTLQTLEVAGAMDSLEFEFVALQEVDPLAHDIHSNMIVIYQLIFTDRA